MLVVEFSYLRPVGSFLDSSACVSYFLSQTNPRLCEYEECKPPAVIQCLCQAVGMLFSHRHPYPIARREWNSVLKIILCLCKVDLGHEEYIATWRHSNLAQFSKSCVLINIY
jgi:hypothetical protein